MILITTMEIYVKIAAAAVEYNYKIESIEKKQLMYGWRLNL